MNAGGITVVGREEELAAIRAFLTARDDLPGALVLEGEPGIGKTVLLRQALAEAPSYRLLAAAPAEAEHELSFTGLMDLLEPVLEPAVMELPPPQRHALEVALLQRDAGGSDPDPRAIGAGVLGVLRALARDGPLLIAVDDVQWLDAASQSALSFAVRRLQAEPVALLLGRRLDAEAERAPLERSWPGERVRALQVGPLTLGAVQRILRERLGNTLPRPVVRRVWQASAGNPFFALEIAQGLRDRVASAAPGQPLPVPKSLARLVRDRVGALPPVALRALWIVAAASTPTLGLLESALGTDIRPLLEPAVDAKIVELHGERIRFVHPLFASAVYSLIGDDKRRELHLSLARLIDDEEERTRHLARAAEAPDEQAAAALEKAARKARSRGATSAAAELCEEALRLTPPTSQDLARRRRLDASGYHFESGDTARAINLLQEAVASSPRGPARAESLSGLARIHVYEGDRRAAVELFQQALTEAGDEPVLRWDAEEGIAISLFLIRQDLARAAVHARAAVELAELTRDPSHLAVALGTRGLVAGLRAATEEAAGALEAAVQLEDAAAQLRPVQQPTFNLAVFLFWTDQFQASVSSLDAASERAVMQGDDSSLPWILGYRSLGEWTLGQWEQAERSAEDGYEIALQTGQRAQQALALASRALVAAGRGDEDGGRSDAESALVLSAEHDAMVGTITATWALGLLDLSLGKADEAHRRLAPLVERLEAAGVEEPGSMRFVTDEIEALILLGELDGAAALLDRTENRARRLDRASVRAACARCDGLLAAARQDNEAAEDALRRARHEHERMTIPFDRARTLVAHGSLLRRMGRKRDARATLEEAQAEFEQLGAALWAEAARAELARIGGRAPSRGELTPTEEKVAALVVEGRTNRQVAAALFVTERTVEYHLGNIYRKLGVRSRAELARRLVRASPRRRVS
jgi:DNA-binding CsgD family transcriptional regulator